MGVDRLLAFTLSKLGLGDALSMGAPHLRQMILRGRASLDQF